MISSLIQKYNVAGPRYTSYPTVPYWEEDKFNLEVWKKSLINSFNESNKKEGISIYIHLPFCESLCTFCGCNKRITKQHSVEEIYIDYVLKEWKMYLDLLKDKPIIKELHLGGGTPTFFSPKNLNKLISNILNSSEKSLNFEFSFEGHPNNTTKEHLQTLFELGFKRVSFGVQDYNEKVQKAINRIQTFDKVKEVTLLAKNIGYDSISHDIIFGLPFQTLDDVLNTIEKTNLLSPDRLAFYSYAHVPWIKGNGQRGFDEKNLPKETEKRLLYEEGKKQLIKNGYIEIGMDHFSLKTDYLYKSFEEKKLHRNFMGYTSSKTQLMLSLGVSAISDSWYAFAQNEKDLENYYNKLNKHILPIFRGHSLSDEDLIIRKHILNLMCQFETSWENDNMKFDEIDSVIYSLREMEKDNLIEIKQKKIIIKDAGKAFARNICMAFDLRLKRKQPKTQLFSMTI